MNIFSKINTGKLNNKFSIGLDIGTQLIKVVKLKIGVEPELVAFDCVEPGLDLTETLKKIKYAQGADFVNISFCGSSTVIRYVDFLRMNKSELRQALKFEAQKHIPFSLDEVNLDAEILKKDLPENKMLVLIAALKKEATKQRIKTLEDAGLKAEIIDIDSLALINAFNFSKVENIDNRTICLLNIGASVSNVNIIANGIPRLSRDIHCAGVNFTNKIMDVLGVDFKTAEALKITPDAEKAEMIKAGIESVLTDLALEIRSSFDYYESQNTSNVAKIFLSGGGSKITGLKENLALSLGMEVESWDAFKQVKISEEIDKQKLNQFSSQFNVAVGLALRQR